MFFICRCQLWKAYCNNEDITDKDAEELHTHFRICNLHFEKRMFSEMVKERLKITAVPTVSIVLEENLNDSENLSVETIGKKILNSLLFFN